jgi:hypothetical protein
LAIDSLLDKVTKAQVKAVLNTIKADIRHLPTSEQVYDKAYTDAIDRIENQRPGFSKLAKDALTWIIYAVRPLETRELCHALAINIDDEDLDEDNVVDILDIVAVCAGLVIIDRESDIVRLVHYTAQEYFERKGSLWLPNHQSNLTAKCLTYLRFKRFQNSSFFSMSIKDRRRKQSSLVYYASKHWGNHAKTVQDSISELIMCFLTKESLVHALCEFYFSDYYNILHDLDLDPLVDTDECSLMLAWFGLDSLYRDFHNQQPKNNHTEETEKTIDQEKYRNKYSILLLQCCLKISM